DWPDIISKGYTACMLQDVIIIADFPTTTATKKLAPRYIGSDLVYQEQPVKSGQDIPLVIVFIFYDMLKNMALTYINLISTLFLIIFMQMVHILKHPIKWYTQ
ncbi:hypothetical protein ACJX0J_024823, partial [Zea mays]